LLENLQSSRQRDGVRKTADRAEVEQRLETLCRIQGEKELNRLRERATTLSTSIGIYVSSCCSAFYSITGT
jgi:hypothetical protein